MIGRNRIALVVDDVAVVRGVLSRQLATLGFAEIVQVASAEEALAKLKQRRFDLVVVDWLLSGMSGDELVLRLRADRAAWVRELPVVMVSGHTGEATVRKAQEAGVDAFLQKPIVCDELEARIRHAFTKRGLL